MILKGLEEGHHLQEAFITILDHGDAAQGIEISFEIDMDEPRDHLDGDLRDAVESSFDISIARLPSCEEEGIVAADPQQSCCLGSSSRHFS